MKRNKIAAAALALALVTPVVANAAEVKTETTETKITGGTTNGADAVGSIEYTRYGNAYVEAFKAWQKAVKESKEADEAYAAAKKAYDDAVAELQARHVAIENQFGKVMEAYKRVNGFKQQMNLNFTSYYVDGEGLTAGNEPTLVKHEYKPYIRYDELGCYKKLVEFKFDRVSPKTGEATPNQYTDAQIQGAIMKYNGDVAILNEEIKAYNALINREAEAILETKIEKLWNAYQEALRLKNIANAKVAPAKKALDDAHDLAVKYGADKATLIQAEKLGDLSLVTKTIKTTTTTPKKDTTVTTTTETSTKPGKVEETKKGLTAAQKAALEKAIADAEVQIQAVKFLKETTPKTIAPVAEKLDKLVAEQKARLVKAKAILDANKVAISDILFSTAYAAEETEDVDALIKEINDSTEEIKDTLKANEAAQPEVKEEEKKPEDKKEETTKVIEKTVVKPASTNKSAGSNAKTGIAGVAGVAGVLAAASVAYAASKKN